MCASGLYMSKFTNIFLVSGILLADAICAHALQMTPQIQSLLDEKQQKIEALEKCEGKKQGWMIAGISTIGLTAVGVVGNIALANKSKNLSTQIESSATTLKNAQSELSDLNNQIIAEKQRQETLEKEKQLCNSTNGKWWDTTNEKCVDNTQTVSKVQTPRVKTTDAGTKSLTTKTTVIPKAETDITEPNVDASRWTETEYKQCFNNFSNYNGSSNAKSFLAKSNNGQYCDGYGPGNEYDYKKNPNTCLHQNFKQLNEGEWKVTLKNGKSMSGIAVCSKSSASVQYELRDSIDENTEGVNCWCKLIQTDLAECLITEKFSWMFVGDFDLVDESDIEDFNIGYNKFHNLMPQAYYQIGGNSCLWHCAYECANQLLDYGTSHQRTMHGVPLIRQFIGY